MASWGERAMIMSSGQEARKGPLHPAPPPSGAHPARWLRLAWGLGSLSEGGPSAQTCPALWALQSPLPAKRGQQRAEMSHHPSGGHLNRGRTPHVLPSSAPSAKAAQQSRDTTFLSCSLGPTSLETSDTPMGEEGPVESPSSSHPGSCVQWRGLRCELRADPGGTERRASPPCQGG